MMIPNPEPGTAEWWWYRSRPDSFWQALNVFWARGAVRCCLYSGRKVHEMPGEWGGRITMPDGATFYRR